VMSEGMSGVSCVSPYTLRRSSLGEHYGGKSDRQIGAIEDKPHR
jgi:hypothetical protein